MKHVDFKDLKAKVWYDRNTEDVIIFSNIPYLPILSDPSLLPYTEFDFGYVRLSFSRDSKYVRLVTNSKSSNKLIVLKRACTVVSNFVLYATLEKVLLHKCVLWSSAKSKRSETKALKHKLMSSGLDLKQHALKTFPERSSEIHYLEHQLLSLHGSMISLALKLHIASGSKDVAYLNELTYSAWLKLKATQ